MVAADPREAPRFGKRQRIRAGGLERAQRLRAKPTYTEARLWERLRLLPIRIRRQAPVGRFVVDFACLRARLIIEVDGGVHALPDVALRDYERDAALRAEGFTILRFDARRVSGDLDAVVSEIEAAIRASVPTYNRSASTPSQPSPLEGEGSGL
jgi:very-short-patch-repair endonuclease